MQTEPTTFEPGDPGPSGPSADEMVTISRSELEALRARAGSPAGRPEEAAEADRRLAELEKAYRGAVLDRELATALAGRPLVPGAAAQLIKLWREDFDVYESDGSLRAVSREGKPLAKAVAERLAEPEFAHFRAPSSRGGAAARGANRPPGPEPIGAKTLGEAALIRWREAASGPTGAAQAIGLRRR